MKNLDLFVKFFSFCALIGYASGAYCMKSSQDIYNLLKNPSTNCLQGVKIVLSGEKAPNYDVPSTGAGDCLFYPRILGEYLQSLGAQEVVVDLGKKYGWLKKFFEKCSDIKVFANIDEEAQKEYVRLEVRDVLDTQQVAQMLSVFEYKTRYLSGDSKNCDWANQEVEKVCKNMEKITATVKEKSGHAMLPVLFTRQSAAYKIKNKDEEKLFGYLNHRSISREDLAEILQGKEKYVNVYNIQFEDQKENDILGTEKPVKLYEDYVKRNGAFVNDAILMKAVIKAAGQIVSIDSSPLMLALGIPEFGDTRKNIKALLGKNHNSRWKKPFLRDNGSVCWSPNVELMIQDKEDDWSSVGEKLRKGWKSVSDTESCVIL